MGAANAPLVDCSNRCRIVCRVGANRGGGWGSRDVDYTPNDSAATQMFVPAGGGPPGPVSFDSSGVVGGVQLGYNWQFNQSWLIGVETDFNGSGIKGSASSAASLLAAAPLSATIEERIKWFGTVRGRLGYLPAPNLLAYVTGGFAYGRVEHTGSWTDISGNLNIFGPAGGFSAVCNPFATCFAGSSSSVAGGWTVGGGLEYAFWQNLTLKAEYLYVSLEGKSLSETALLVTPGTAPASLNANFNRTNFNVARVGVNYRF
jgi:outer membrane immunogenic protein